MRKVAMDATNPIEADYGNKKSTQYLIQFLK